jgi:hypothetical protein
MATLQPPTACYFPFLSISVLVASSLLTLSQRSCRHALHLITELSDDVGGRHTLFDLVSIRSTVQRDGTCFQSLSESHSGPSCFFCLPPPQSTKSDQSTVKVLGRFWAKVSRLRLSKGCCHCPVLWSNYPYLPGYGRGLMQHVDHRLSRRRVAKALPS